jgi:hypothetical protein
MNCTSDYSSAENHIGERLLTGCCGELISQYQSGFPLLLDVCSRHWTKLASNWPCRSLNVRHWFPTAAARFRVRAHVRFVVDKAAMGRFPPSTSVSPANHSTNFSIIVITRGWHNRPISGLSAKWTQLTPPPHYTNF